MYRHKFNALNFMRSCHSHLTYEENIEIGGFSVRKLKILLLIMEYLLSCLENGNLNMLNIFKRCGAQSFIMKCKLIHRLGSPILAFACISKLSQILERFN